MSERTRKLLRDRRGALHESLEYQVMGAGVQNREESTQQWR